MESLFGRSMGQVVGSFQKKDKYLEYNFVVDMASLHPNKVDVDSILFWMKGPDYDLTPYNLKLDLSVRQFMMREFSLRKRETYLDVVKDYVFEKDGLRYEDGTIYYQKLEKKVSTPELE